MYKKYANSPSPHLLVKDNVWLSNCSRVSNHCKALKGGKQDMKRYNDLFNKICTIENFQKAYKNAIKGKKHYKEVRAIERYGRNRYLKSLLEEVRSKEYKVSEYEIFNLYTGGKWREIYKLPMKDRIVQHAIMIWLEPIFRENFIADTYSSIKTRGIHRGLQRVKRALRKSNVRYCLKLDIHKCYPSLDKDILKHKLHKKFKDKDLCWLLDEIVDSCGKGVPIGNYTSQYFNNFYFSNFDHWIKEVLKVKWYFRYCDDMVFLGESKKELRNIFKKVQEYIKILNVELKPNWQIYPIEDRSIDFLGYKIRRKYVLLRKTTRENFKKKIQDINFDNLKSRDVNVLGSYWGILIHADARHLWQMNTDVKDFKELGIKTHERDFLSNFVGILLIVNAVRTYYKKGNDVVELTADYVDKKGDEHDDVYIITHGEIALEQASQIKNDDCPFKTVPFRDDKGFLHIG